LSIFKVASDKLVNGQLKLLLVYSQWRVMARFAL